MDAAEGDDSVESAEPPDPSLITVLQAMSDPQRLAMLKVLSDDEWHACGAGDWATGLHKSTISHHIRVLREAGLFEGQQRGRKKYGRLRRDAIDGRFPGLLNSVLSNA